jgi:hypothetical protein
MTKSHFSGVGRQRRKIQEPSHPLGSPPRRSRPPAQKLRLQPPGAPAQHSSTGPPPLDVNAVSQRRLTPCCVAAARPPSGYRRKPRLLPLPFLAPPPLPSSIRFEFIRFDSIWFPGRPRRRQAQHFLRPCPRLLPPSHAAHRGRRTRMLPTRRPQDQDLQAQSQFFI